MNTDEFGLSEEQILMRRNVAALLARVLPAEEVRRLDANSEFPHVAFDALAMKFREFKLRKMKVQHELEQKQRALGYKERQLQVAEQKLELTRARLRGAVSALERKTAKGKSLNTEDIRRIRAVYGLGFDPPAQEKN